MFKPMLAQSVSSLKEVFLPVLASVKLDGIRCEYRTSPRTDKLVAMSREMLPIPNRYIRNTIEQYGLPSGLSGELIVGKDYHETESAVMSIDGMCNFTWNLFDFAGVSQHAQAQRRYDALLELQLPARFKVIPKQLILTLDDLITFEQATFRAGFEGIVLNNPVSFYHCGRSNLTVQHCLRYTRRIRKEAIALEFIELQRNDAPVEISALGYVERSASKAFKRAGGTLGAILCKDVESGVEFEVGSFRKPKKELREMWREREQLKGNVFTYEYKPYGVKDKPRQPVFIHWRKIK